MSELEEINGMVSADQPQNGEEYRRVHQITVSGFEISSNGSTTSVQFKCPEPMTSFASTPFAPPIRTALINAGFSSPTPTQAQACNLAHFSSSIFFALIT